MRRCLVGVLLLAGEVSAQSLTLSMGSGTVMKNGGDCSDVVSGTWETSSLGTVCSELEIWLTTARSCDDAPASSDVVVETVSQSTLSSSSSGSFSFQVSTLPAFDGGTPCGVALDVTTRVCGSLERQSSGGSCDSTVQASAQTVRYDAVTPGPPSVSVEPLDSKIRVVLSPRADDDADDVTRFFVDVALELPDGGPDSWRNVGGEVGSRYTVMGLQNGVRYLVRGIAIDEAENRSAPSSPVEATPVATAGFLERYKESGGSEVGCGSSLPGLLLSCLAGQGRRRR
jgi:hypothetical protein